MRLIILALSLALIGFAAPAHAKTKCVRTFTLQEFDPIDSYHVLITGRSNKELYLVTTTHTCRDMNFSSSISTTFNNKYTCPPFAEYIRTDDRTCAVKWIQKVDSRAQALSLAARDEAARKNKKKLVKTNHNSTP